MADQESWDFPKQPRKRQKRKVFEEDVHFKHERYRRPSKTEEELRGWVGRSSHEIFESEEDEHV